MFKLAVISVLSRKEYSVQGNSKFVFPLKGYSIQQESQIMLIGGAYSSTTARIGLNGNISKFEEK